MSTPDKQALLAQLQPYGQQHVLAFWDQLDARGQSQLAVQVAGLDLAQLAALTSGQEHHQDWAALAARATPPPAMRLDDPHPVHSAEQARTRGREALADGKIAALVVAGGQGTRLGFDQPKGMYPIGPLSQATLFQLLCEKMLAVSRRAGFVRRPGSEPSLPLLVMTSPATDAATREFFAAHQGFGVAEPDLRIFCQGTMPAVDAQTGKLLLSAPDSLSLSPDGHGGTLAALAASGALAWLRELGVEQLFYFQVDNPLVRVCDPEMIGYHLLSGSQVSTKVVAKRSPRDRLGNVVQVDGRVQIIEYSDLPDEAAERRNPDGSLELWAGNIAVHVFDVAFLADLAGTGRLPFHRAHKKVPYLDSDGQRVEPTEPNAIKFEKFIFDALPAAETSIVVETAAADEFAAVKNAPGSGLESPEWVQEMIVAQHTRWLQSTGATVDPGVKVEISPLFALDADMLGERIAPGLHVTADRYFAP